MDGSDWLAAAAAAIAAAALALEVRRWVESGPRLTLSVIYPAETSDPSDKSKYVAVSITNRGDLPTTITHMFYSEYTNTIDRLRGLTSWQAIVPEPSPQRLPYVLEPGKIWMGMGRETPKLKSRIDKGDFYVAIAASHRSKVFRRRLKPARQLRRVATK